LYDHMKLAIASACSHRGPGPVLEVRGSEVGEVRRHSRDRGAVRVGMEGLDPGAGLVGGPFEAVELGEGPTLAPGPLGQVGRGADATRRRAGVPRGPGPTAILMENHPIPGSDLWEKADCGAGRFRHDRTHSVG